MESERGQWKGEAEIEWRAEARPPLGAAPLTCLEDQQVFDCVPQRIQVAANGYVEGSAQARCLTELSRDERIVGKDRCIRCNLAHRAERAEGRDLGELGVEENQIETATAKVYKTLVKAMCLGDVHSAASTEREEFKHQLTIEIVVLDEENFRCRDHGSQPSRWWGELRPEAPMAIKRQRYANRGYGVAKKSVIM